MYYIRRFSVRPYDAALASTLENDYGIPCKVLTHPETEQKTFFVFEVSDLHPQIEELNKILPESTSDEEYAAQWEHYYKTGEVITNQVVVSHLPQYSEDERRNAKWLEASNVNSKLMPVNCESIDGHMCFVKLSKLGEPLGRHEVQNEPYVIKSPIKWGRSAFVSAYCHGERLFCNDAIRAILEKQNVTGVWFAHVLKKSTGQPMDDIYQLDFTHTIPDGAVVSIERMEDYVCQQCGMHMLRSEDGRSRYGLRSGVLDENIDFWQTQPMFLGRPSTEAIRGQRRLIISQKLYRLLVENKLNRGFAFTPLDIVDK